MPREENEYRVGRLDAAGHLLQVLFDVRSRRLFIPIIGQEKNLFGGRIDAAMLRVTDQVVETSRIAGGIEKRRHPGDQVMIDTHEERPHFSRAGKNRSARL